MNEGKPDTLGPEMRPDPAAQFHQPGQKRWLVIGGAGCVLLLCLGLFIGGGLFLVGSRLKSAPKTGVSQATGPAGSSPEIEPEAGATVPEPEVTAAVSGPAPLTVSGQPWMSPITFAAQTTAAGEPLESDFAFATGTTSLHAIFEYANLTSQQIWTQVWYHNGSEVLRSGQPWLEAAAGTFDYPVEAGGAPLPAGEWALEFYVDDELLTAGSFVIEAAEPAQATVDPTDLPSVYLLAFTRWNGEKHDLYVADSNGDREQFIMGRAAGPSWSLDGRYIFFYGEEGVDQQVLNGQVYPLPGVTNGIVRLAAAPLPTSVSQLQLYQGHGWNDGTARWANVAPDGTMIAYDGDRGGGRRIYFLGTDANQQFRYEIIGEQADWSPDSQQIVYRSGRNNQTGIWISNRTDSGHTRITTEGTDSFPAWSPDGQTIAFSREVGGNVDIYTVKVDGTDLQRLTDTPGHDTLPAYLPNGDLVFRSARTGSWGIWKMGGDGSGQEEIIANAPVGPDWSFSRIGVQR